MTALLSILTIAGVHFLAVISPGPNFLVVTKSALGGSRRAGVLAAGGVATGSLIYIGLGFLGVSAIVAQSVWVFNLLKLLGAVYLTYLGLKAFVSKAPPAGQATSTGAIPPLSDSALVFYRTGLITTFSNPQSALYFLALFTTFISPTTTLTVKLAMAVVMVTISWLWYTSVAVFFSNGQIQRVYARFRRWLDYLFGALLVGLALKLAMA